MLKKEALSRTEGGEPFVFTIEERSSMDYSERGYGTFSDAIETDPAHSKIPYWTFDVGGTTGKSRFKLNGIRDNVNGLVSNIDLKSLDGVSEGNVPNIKVMFDGTVLSYSSFKYIVFRQKFIGSSDGALGLKDKYLAGIRQASVTFDPPPTGYL